MAGLGRVLNELGTSQPSAPTRQIRDFAPKPSTAAQAISPIESFVDRARIQLVEVIGASLTAEGIGPGELRQRVTEELAGLIEKENLPLTRSERQKILTDVTNDVVGYGPIEALLEDPSVSEIMVNGTDSIYIERDGQIVLTDIVFRTDAHLRQIIQRIVSSIGRRVDEMSPMVDARLPDGSRVNAIIAPLAVDGASLTIRKFSRDGLSAADLVERNSLSRQALTFLQAAIVGRLNILVSGGTGTGKTTFLNILSSFIPDTDRIVTIEDAVELRLRQRHVIRLECRPANVEGVGAVGTRELVRNSLRMRPDRIIVGECRGGEALDMLQAMNTGHDGSLTTLHANTPRDALSRIETMVMMAGFDLPSRAIREQIVSAVDVIVQLERLRSGARVVSSIAEVNGASGDGVLLNELYALDYSLADTGRQLLRPTGETPKNAEKMEKNGASLDPSMFKMKKYGPWIS